MALPRSHALAVLTLLVLAAVVLPASAPASAAPPPEAVCGLCTDDALGGGVQHGEAVVRVQADGSANWTVRADLDEETAAALRNETATRRDRVREELTHRTVVEAVETLDTRVENRTLVATFLTPDFAHRGVGGVLVVDGLFPSTPNAQVHVEAGRLAIYGPAGTTPTLVPNSAVGNEDHVVWAWDADLGSRTYIAFGDGGLVATVLTVAAVGVEMAGRILPDLLPVVALPTLLFAGVLAGLLHDGDRLVGDATDDELASRVGLGGGVGALALLAAGVALFLIGTNTNGGLVDPFVYLGATLVSLVPGTLVAAGLAATLALWGDRIALDSYAWWAFPAASICWLVVVGATGSTRLFGTWTTTVLLFLLLGAAHERGALAALPVALVALLTPTLAAGPILSSFVPPSVLVLWTVGTLVAGVALYVLGRKASARTGPSESADGDEPDAEAA